MPAFGGVTSGACAVPAMSGAGSATSGVPVQVVSAGAKSSNVTVCGDATPLTIPLTVAVSDSGTPPSVGAGGDASVVSDGVAFATVDVSPASRHAPATGALLMSPL